MYTNHLLRAAIINFAEQMDLKQSLSQESLNINFLAYMAEALRIRQNLTSLRDMVINGRREYVSDIGHPKRLIASYANSKFDCGSFFKGKE